MYAVSVLCLVSLIWAPDFDYCASQGKHYFGYKLHVLCGLSGVIHSYDPPKASVYDINYMKDIKPLYRDCCIFGDKGYSVRKSNLTFSKRSISDLNAPPGSTKRTGGQPSSLSPFAKARKRVETLFSQLADQFLLIRNHAKETCGLFARVVGRISAMTTLQCINYINNKPIGRIKYALI